MPRLLTEEQRGDAMRERETAPPPKNFKEKLVHFLDYHKWWIFWGVLIFSLGTFMICNTGEKFDYFVAVYAQTSSPEEAGSLYGFPNALAA
ncbi:MAG: hypothetical protein FWE86_03850, partial [Oscillospiraceae bacterium]|nr:hypothetical protein [Oscillospiraceae bacterium]